MASNKSINNPVPRKWKDELIPNIIDYVATADPESLYAEYPVSPLTYDEGYRKITYRDFSNAINGIAAWLIDVVGPPKIENEVLTYMGPNDLRYAVLIVGAVKVGYLLFLTSPRNSIVAQMKLLDGLNCTIVLSPTPRPPQITEILEADEKFKVFDVPCVDDLIEKTHPRFPYDKNYAESSREPLCVVHTSGSTGIPKTLIYSHEFATSFMHLMNMEPPPGFESQDRLYNKKRLLVTFPPFHGAYLAFTLCNAVPFGSIIISPISGALPSAEGVIEVLKRTPIDAALIVPSVARELSQEPELLDLCAKNLETLFYSGGHLPQAIGDLVASKVRLLNQFGASELGITPQIYPKNSQEALDWKHVIFHPDAGYEFRPALNDTYELCVVRKPEIAEKQPSFILFPHLDKIYQHGDLFVRHPSEEKKDYWRWTARADDVIVFLNGEKTNPVSMEQHIVARNPEIRAALVMGAQRFQASLLIDLVDGDKELSVTERAAIIERIWPSIEEANQECPAHARIAKTHIFFSHPDKRILISGKGGIQRAGTLLLFEEELDSLYADADKMAGEVDGEEAGTVDITDSLAVAAFLRKSISSVNKWSDFGDTEDFFTLGLDSLQSLTLVRRLRHGLAMPEIAVSTIYTNPSVVQLTDAITKLASRHDVSNSSSLEEQHQMRTAVLKDFQDKIDQIALPKQRTTSGSGQTIVLTGSTGALGSYILETLLSRSETAHVYCLNRSPSSEDLQKSRNKTRSLATEFDPARITFLTADLAQPLLGLQSNIYSKLVENVTLIIHNAWPVNFNMSLPSFRPSLEGLVNLIALSASPSTSLFFVSSISSVMAYHTPSQLTPEELIPTFVSEKQPVPGRSGYAESKYISELLLSYVSDKMPSMKTNLSFARVGQIAGPVRKPGMWNKTEWFPSLVLSSLHVGAIPNALGSTLGRIDWVPVDLLAEVLVELALNSNEKEGLKVFHLMNPKVTTWDDLRPALASYLSNISGESIETVPGEVWISKVRKDMESKAGAGNVLKKGELEGILETNPAVKLLDFYEGILGSKEVGNVFNTMETEKMSAKLRALEGVKAEWVEKWVGEWIKKS